MLKKQIMYKDLDYIADYINTLSKRVTNKFKKQDRLNRILTVLSIVTLGYAVNEIKNIKEEIKELKNKKGV